MGARVGRRAARTRENSGLTESLSRHWCHSGYGWPRGLHGRRLHIRAGGAGGRPCKNLKCALAGGLLGRLCRWCRRPSCAASSVEKRKPFTTRAGRGSTCAGFERPCGRDSRRCRGRLRQVQIRAYRAAFGCIHAHPGPEREKGARLGRGDGSEGLRPRCAPFAGARAATILLRHQYGPRASTSDIERKHLAASS